VKTGLFRAVLGLVFLFGMEKSQADPLNQWVWRYPIPQGETLRAVVYGGAQYVAVGDNGTIITSPDGYNWSVQSYGVFTNLTGVAYAAGEYAAVGAGGVILVSSNAVAWTQIAFVTTKSLHSIVGDITWQYDGVFEFLAVGDAGTAVAYQGTHWSTISSGTTNNLYGIAADEYCAVGNGGTVEYVNANGLEPVQDEFGTVATTNNLYAVADIYNGDAVAVGDMNSSHFTEDGVLVSTDGNDQYWSPVFNLSDIWSPSSEFILRAIATGPSGVVAVGDTGYTLEYVYPGVVFTSANGTSWSESSSTTSENRLYGCTYGNGLYVLVGDAGGIVVSSNLVNWTEVTSYHRSAITAIACSTNLCIASAQPMPYSGFANFSTIVSSNGANWVVSTLNLPAMVDLTCGGNQFVGVNYNNIYTTTDGYNWLNDGSYANYFHGVKYVNGQFVAVGDSGSIYTSFDGTNWNNVSVVSTNSFYGVAYGSGLYVAAGSGVATSTDGVTWSLASSNLPAFITRIVYGKGLFVAAAYTGDYYYPNGEILTSTNGINWNVQLSAPSGAFTGLAYSGGTFLAITAVYSAPDGAMFKSSDGTNWAQITYELPDVDNNAFSLYYYPLNQLSLSYLNVYATLCSENGTFLAGGLDGILAQSGNIWNPPALISAQVASNGFGFSYNEQVDVPYRILASTNLSNWATVYSGVGTGQPTNFVYTISSNGPAQFFRMVSP